MTTTAGTYPTVDTVVADALRFLRGAFVRQGLSIASANIATQKGSERWMTCSAFANGLAVVLANNRALEDATMADTATGDDLLRICAVYGILPSLGTGATGDGIVSCTGTVTYPAGSQLTAASGKRYQTIAVYTVTSGLPVSIAGIDIGKDTNLDPGTVLTWTSPPPGSASTCVVGAGGLTNGAPADNDATLRKRLLERLQKPQNGGSWAHYRKWGEDSSAAVENLFVYPAAQGPATVHVAYTVAGTRDNNYARAGSVSLTQTVANYIGGQAPEFSDLTCTTVAEQALSVGIKATLPGTVAEGGAGGGWVNSFSDRWPKITAFSIPAQVNTILAPNQFVVNNVLTLPTTATVVHVWDSTNRKLYTATVLNFSSTGAGPYNVTVTLDTSLPTIIVGDYMFPAMERGKAYAEEFCAQIATLAPGEKTINVDVLPRAYRHPRAVDGLPSAVTTLPLAHLQNTFPEMTNATFVWLAGTAGFSLPLEPDIASVVTNPPNVWRVGFFAIYPVT